MASKCVHVFGMSIRHCPNQTGPIAIFEYSVLVFAAMTFLLVKNGVSGLSGLAHALCGLCVLCGAVCLLAAGASAADNTYRVEVAPPGRAPVKLYAEETGSGPPVLLLPGLGASTFTWRHIVPRLSKSHRVIAVDLKGFGRSQKPLDLDYTAQHQAELVAAFIESRDLQGVTLVGHSFGGTVALFTPVALGRQQDRVGRLVLLAAPVLHQELPEATRAISLPAAPYGLLGPLPPQAVARLLLTYSRRAGSPPSDEDVRGYAAPFYDLGSKHAFIVSAQSIVEGDAWRWAKSLKRVRQPKLLIWCRKDEIVPISGGRKLARILSNARLKTLSRCNHLPQDEQPRALVKAMRGFLD